MLYVVRRAFRNYGEVLTPGCVVQPENIKQFKARLRDHVIVGVPEKDFEKWDAYFVAKFGVHIQLPAEESTEEPAEEPTEEPTEEPIVVAAVVKN